MTNKLNQNYSFSDLFSADKNLTEEGKNHREKVTIAQLIQLELLYPSMKFNK